MTNTTFEIEQAMLVPERKCIYIIGCPERGKITVHSQQTRAFNLAYALIEEKKLNSDSKVAIIGGGVSGVTLAAALTKVGCKIDLYEIRQQVLGLQWNSTRFIHPNIFDWPETNSTSSKTNLPFFNWDADTAGNVIKKLRNIWEYVLDTVNYINVKTKTEVKGVEEIVDGNHCFAKLTFGDSIKKNKNSNDESASYHIVVYAGGFGLEQNIRSNPLSYWENDSFDQNTRYKKKYKLKIYGTGDGGLIDAIRTSLSDFDYSAFVDKFTKHDSFDALGKSMLSIEQALQKNDHVNKNELSVLLKQEYDRIFTPNFQDLQSLIKKYYPLRENIAVTLFGRESTPYNLQSTLLNRMIVYIIIRAGIINYQQIKETRFDKLLQSKNENLKNISLFIYTTYNLIRKTKVIERIGSEKPYRKFFSIPSENYTNLDILSVGLKQYWANKYFDDCPHLKKMPADFNYYKSEYNKAIIL